MNRPARTSLAACFFLVFPAFAQDYDFDWATIDHPDNAPYQGTIDEWITSGHGRVAHTYRMSKLEVTTAQWMEFVNTFSTQSDDLAYFAAPLYWGATEDHSYGGPGIRWKLLDTPGAAMRPVTGFNWRTAAQFCNWLHNDKRSDLDAIKNGAYDTSTFVRNADGSFADQSTHNPDAKFWIPTLDEWLKAVHYDPDRYGTDQGGWWRFPNTSDTAPIPGIPGVGETSAGYEPFGYFEGLEVPLGSYPTTLTPWGLLDASGGASEWLEDWLPPPDSFHYYRLYDGAPAGTPNDVLLDDLGLAGASVAISPDAHIGLRIASIPTPTTPLAALTFFLIFTPRRRR